MATCKICGEKYLQKKCPYCFGTVLNQENKKHKKMKIGRIESNRKPNNKKTSYITIAILIFMIMIVIFKVKENNNPLLGKWRSTGNTIKNVIEFKKDEMITYGMASYVNYDVEDDKVIVRTGELGIVYNIIDKNTISQNMLGITTIYYKRIK